MLLRVKNVNVYYKKAVALSGVSLEVPEGTVVAIIGANGAGKSTLLKALSGLIPISSGEVYFMNNRIDKMATYDIVGLGLVQVPEGRRLFPYLSVLDNLLLGASLRKDKSGIAEDLSVIFEYFPTLKDRKNQQAGTLSGGEQQMLAIGRALLSKGKLLLLDEPSLGLAPVIVSELGQVIRDINMKGLSVLLAEQNIPLALEVANTGYVVQAGSVILEGDIDNLKHSKVVQRAYLGE
jgi:branched-chain amino acid transport system ATP-binding protein